jgi:hypothetical protein
MEYVRGSTVRRSLGVLVLSWLFRQLEIVLSIPEVLGEHAIIGWVNEQIAKVLGITSPTVDQIVGGLCDGRRLLFWLCCPFPGGSLLSTRYAHAARLLLKFGNMARN